MLQRGCSSPASLQPQHPAESPSNTGLSPGLKAALQSPPQGVQDPSSEPSPSHVPHLSLGEPTVLHFSSPAPKDKEKRVTSGGGMTSLCCEGRGRHLEVQSVTPLRGRVSFCLRALKKGEIKNALGIPGLEPPHLLWGWWWW